MNQQSFNFNEFIQKNEENEVDEEVKAQEEGEVDELDVHKVVVEELAAEKAELNEKIESFAAATNDSLEEVFENKEQIEIAKFYERLPKPTLIAVHEFLNDQIYFRNPAKENQEAF
jgi:hypothetical protein